MRLDVKNKLNLLPKEVLPLMNKSEIARRLDCDPRTAERYIKQQQGILPIRKPKQKTTILEEFKPIILDKVDEHGSYPYGCFQIYSEKGVSGRIRYSSIFCPQP